MKIERVIKQDPFSPKAINSGLQKVFNKINWAANGLHIDRYRLNELRFTDDVMLLSETMNGLTEMMKNLFEESKYAGLTQNVSQTKILNNQNITH